MEIDLLRSLRWRGAVAIRPSVHAKTEARKDGLTQDDLEFAFEHGEVSEDYGRRALLLSWTPEDKVPFHVIFEDAREHAR